jgi:hypothetical protein
LFTGELGSGHCDSVMLVEGAKNTFFKMKFSFYMVALQKVNNLIWLCVGYCWSVKFKVVI